MQGRQLNQRKKIITPVPLSQTTTFLLSMVHLLVAVACGDLSAHTSAAEISDDALSLVECLQKQQTPARL